MKINKKPFGENLMSLIKPAGKLTWVPSTSTDVVSTRIFWSLDGTDVTYNSPSEDFPITITEASLPFIGMGAVSDVVMKMGIAAIDDAGNISDIVQIDVPLDVIAPESPTLFAFVVD